MNYPTSFRSIRQWANEHSMDFEEARDRFVQYTVLCAISDDDVLRASLVLKGGNALDFVWQSNRSTADLDFSVDPASVDFQPSESTLTERLTRGCQSVYEPLGTMLTVNRVRQRPPGANRTFVTYEATIAYALPNEQHLQLRMRSGEKIARALPIDISINEPICAATSFPLDHERRLRVCTIDDIVAEKLRAILQQSIRNRTRRQDVLDIAVLLQGPTPPNAENVGIFLLAKAAARNVAVSKAAFHVPDVAERARIGYADLAATTRTSFIPFDEALALVLSFVDRLPIPRE